VVGKGDPPSPPPYRLTWSTERYKLVTKLVRTELELIDELEVIPKWDQKKEKMLNVRGVVR